jgi:hypothetical protein
MSTSRNSKTEELKADFAERKVFLRSFIKRIEVNQKQVTIHYNLPMPQDERSKERAEVLPIDTLGGAGGIRTPYLLTASQTFSQLNYGPVETLSNLAENGGERKPRQTRPAL